jgi:hypothetical protein
MRQVKTDALRAHRNFSHIYQGMSKICETNNYGKWQIEKNYQKFQSSKLSHEDSSLKHGL